VFEVGFSEMVVIFALALIVLGPEKLPRLVAQVGRWAGRARSMARQFRDQLETEADLIATPENKIQVKDSKESNEPAHERGA
jgi:sec-independent protein translocase protein TatB